VAQRGKAEAEAILEGVPPLPSAPQAPSERQREREQPAAAAAAAWRAAGAWLSAQGAAAGGLVRRVRRLEGDDRHAAAVALLEAVLEAYTDVTRFPLPRRPEAAVLVAARDDAYVSPASVEELARHLAGSEVRWVEGGHVSSFILHQPAFREAILDSLGRL
jgi:pimeloyl-ACP methyl ester carboxylesterase